MKKRLTRNTALLVAAIAAIGLSPLAAAQEDPVEGQNVERRASRQEMAEQRRQQVQQRREELEALSEEEQEVLRQRHRERAGQRRIIRQQRREEFESLTSEERQARRAELQERCARVVDKRRRTQCERRINRPMPPMRWWRPDAV